MTVQRFMQPGKEKSAIARVYMKSGSSSIMVNKRNYEEYFTRPSLKMIIRQPLRSREKGPVRLLCQCQRRSVAGQAGR